MVCELKVKIRLFAYLRDECGFETKYFDTENSVLEEILSEILEEFPCLLKYDDNILVALNKEFVPLDTEANEGDEIALFPPLSGG